MLGDMECNDIRAAQERVVAHPVYDRVQSRKDLQIFMETHVYAVWSFMSLAKRLQMDLTCVSLPWTPPENRNVARLVNEIILGEETDRIGNGAPISHFELYIDAMREVGANSGPVERLLEHLRKKQSIRELPSIFPSQAVADFVWFDLELACTGSLPAVAGSFLWGREELVPQMFDRMLPVLEKSDNVAPHFTTYARRHIEIDGADHGPMALELLKHVCKTDQDWHVAKSAALSAIGKRMSLWDEVVANLGSFSVPAG